MNRRWRNVPCEAERNAEPSTDGYSIDSLEGVPVLRVEAYSGGDGTRRTCLFWVIMR